MARSRGGGKGVKKDAVTGKLVSDKKTKSSTVGRFKTATKTQAATKSLRVARNATGSVATPVVGRRRILDDSLPEAAAAGGYLIRPGMRASLANRVHRWLAESLDEMSDEEVLKLVEARSPTETIAGLLAAVPDVRRGGDTDWTELLLRGADAKTRIAEFVGGLLSPLETARVLKISVPGVKQRLERRKLLAVPLPGGQRGFPARQFEQDGRVRQGVAEVAAAGANVDPWTLLSILVDEVEDAAGGTLLERLDEPAVRADVLGRLATYGEQGAA